MSTPIISPRNVKHLFVAVVILGKLFYPSLGR